MLHFSRIRPQGTHLTSFFRSCNPSRRRSFVGGKPRGGTGASLKVQSHTIHGCATGPSSSARQTRANLFSSLNLRSPFLKVPGLDTTSAITDAADGPIVHDAFDDATGSWQYIVADPNTSAAVIIDPVLDFDPATGTIDTRNADSILSLVDRKHYMIEMILETHAHADHITAASYLQHRISLKQGSHKRPLIGIGKRIVEVQKFWSERYDIPFSECQGAFDKLFDDGERFPIGNMTASVVHLPGHTPDLIGYKIGDNIFVGDSVFNPDLGTARADFPGGSAEDLYQSGRKILSFPDDLKVWTGHDYPPDGRGGPESWMTVGDHRKNNKHLKDGSSLGGFRDLRQQRDASLAEPRLLHQALQMNIRAGRLPKPTQEGLRMIHIPLKWCSRSESVGFF